MFSRYAARFWTWAVLAGLAVLPFRKYGRRKKKRVDIFFCYLKVLKNRQPSQPNQPTPVRMHEYLAVCIKR